MEMNLLEKGLPGGIRLYDGKRDMIGQSTSKEAASGNATKI